ncbi:MAG TPA: hypothetical protein VF142_11430, partial [Longimicrobium sp.]
MGVVSVLIVVDVEAALAQGLGTNVYLVDTNKYVGSGNEGQAELQTACTNGDTINWTVAPVAPETSVSIQNFTGQMVNDGICTPELVKAPGGIYWSGVVQAQRVTGQQQYSVTLLADG